MDITWPEDRCDLSPNHAHHSVPIFGSIWRCKYCWKCKWQPKYLTEAVQFSISIQKMGVEDAYAKAISRKPGIKKTLRTLEEIRLLKRAGIPEKLLMEAIAAIVVDKEEVPSPDEICRHGSRGKIY